MRRVKRLMETEEISKKKGKGKLMIIILLVIILILISVVGYFLVTGKQISDITKAFESHEEYTVLLDEFVVNLRSENGTKNYLKVEVALMYTDDKQTKTIDKNVNKIRDVIIRNMRSKTSGEIDGENTATIKKELIGDINSELKGNIIKDVYFANMIIQ